MNEITERPKIADFFKSDISVQDVQKIYLENPQLYSYMAALDRYVDFLEKVDLK